MRKSAKKDVNPVLFWGFCAVLVFAIMNGADHIRVVYRPVMFALSGSAVLAAALLQLRAIKPGPWWGRSPLAALLVGIGCLLIAVAKSFDLTMVLGMTIGVAGGVIEKRSGRSTHGRRNV